MAKILFFIFEDMTDYETSLALHLLRVDAGFEVTMMSYEDKIYQGRTGALYKSDALIQEIDQREYSGIIIPGGWFGELRPELKELVTSLNNENKLVAGICGAGTVLLAKSGILSECSFTTPVREWSKEQEQVFGSENPFNYDNLANNCIVRDNNVITATGFGFVDFAVEICDFLNLFENESEKQSFRMMYMSQ